MVYIDKKKFNIYYDVCDSRIKSSLFEVDEFIAPIISILNKKGYKTEYCCSGHLNNINLGKGCGTVPNDNCYITFKIYYNILDGLPNGFYIEADENIYNKTIIIRKYYNKEKDRFYEIINTMKDLYEWTNSLNSINNKNN